MAAQVSRVLGHLTIVGLGNAALPVNFNSPAKECSVASPFWGSIPELIEVISLAQTGKIKMLVEHFALDDAAHAYHLLHDGKIQGRPSSHPTADSAHLVGGDRLRHRFAVRGDDVDVAVDERLASPQTRPTPMRSVDRAGARNCIDIDVVTPRSESGTSAPAQAAAITVTSASAAIAPPCTMSPSVTLVGSHGIRSRTSSPSSTSATMPSLAANGEAGMNCAMTSAPV